jgi:hypothetical protein
MPYCKSIITDVSKLMSQGLGCLKCEKILYRQCRVFLRAIRCIIPLRQLSRPPLLCTCAPQVKITRQGGEAGTASWDKERRCNHIFKGRISNSQQPILLCIPVENHLIAAFLNRWSSKLKRRLVPMPNSIAKERNLHTHVFVGRHPLSITNVTVVGLV